MSRALALREAAELRAALLDHGVRRVSIELQQGRPGTPNGRWFAATFIGAMSHHIVSRRSMGLTPGLALIKKGRDDLPGPLSNLYGGFDEVSRIICMGWANHPGRGGPLVLDGRRIPEDTGRPYLMGTEFEGGLDEDDWTDEFREFMGRHNSGVLDYMGVGPESHVEHSTWAPRRKIDRLGYTTASGRAEVARWFNETLGEDMPTAEEIARAVWGWNAREYVDENGNRVRDSRHASDILWATHRASLAGAWDVTVRRADGQVEAIQELADAKTAALKANVQLDALLKLLGAMTPGGGGLTLEQVRMAVRDSVNEAFSERVSGARVVLVVEDDSTDA